MAFTSLPLALDELTAAKLEALITELRPVSAVKSADTSRNTTTTFSADPHLALNLSAGRTYHIIGNLYLTSAANAAGDFQYRWAWTNDMNVRMGGIGAVDTLASGSSGDGQFARNQSDTTSPTNALSYGVSTTGTNVLVTARVLVTTAGTLTLNWTQLSSNANNTTLEAGSWLTAWVVN